MCQSLEIVEFLLSQRLLGRTKFEVLRSLCLVRSGIRFFEVGATKLDQQELPQPWFLKFDFRLHTYFSIRYALFLFLNLYQVNYNLST
jgi:hypothetical protein